MWGDKLVWGDDLVWGDKLVWGDNLVDYYCNVGSTRAESVVELWILSLS